MINQFSLRIIDAAITLDEEHSVALKKSSLYRSRLLRVG